MSTASAEARAQCAARLRILHRPGRSPRRQRNPGDQDRCRVAQRADVPRPTGSERSENSRGDHVCSRSRQPREHRTHTPSNRIRPCGELMPPGLFGSTTIDCSACMEKTNTRGTAGATGVVVALEPVSKMAADITDGRALGGNLRLIRSPRRRSLARANVVDRMTGSLLELAR